MFNVGSPELLVILVVALLVLGPTKLPEAARQVGRAMGELRRLSSGFQAELRDAMQEPVASRPITAEPAVIVGDPPTIESTLSLEPLPPVATGPEGAASAGTDGTVGTTGQAGPDSADEAPPA